MLKIDKKGFVIIYVLILTIIGVFAAFILFNNLENLRLNHETMSILQNTNQNIVEQRKITLSNWQKYNTDSIGLDDCRVSSDTDNDGNARKEITGYIKNDTLKNVFLSNTVTSDFIFGNSNNFDTYNKLISQVSSGSLYIDLKGGAAYIKLITLDKTKYNQYKEYYKISENSSVISGTGYMQVNSTLNTNKNYFFDFTKYDYAIFMSGGNISNPIEYKIKVDDITGSGVYINPIQDNYCNLTKIELLGYSLNYDMQGKISGNIVNTRYGSSINILNFGCILGSSILGDCKF